MKGLKVALDGVIGSVDDGIEKFRQLSDAQRKNIALAEENRLLRSRLTETPDEREVLL